jgi:hypothetical protein
MLSRTARPRGGSFHLHPKPLMAIDFYVNSFIEIVRFLSNDHVNCDASTKLRTIVDEDFNESDFDIALNTFEATHRLAFNDSLFEVTFDLIGELSIEEMLEKYLDTKTEQKDPLFVAERVQMIMDNQYRDIFGDEGEFPVE